MKRMTPFAIALLAGAGLAGADDSIQWATDWDAAVKEARARNVPIVIAVHGDH